MKSYILFKVQQFGVKEVRRQHLHIYAGSVYILLVSQFR